MSLVRNEQSKLTATFLNGLGIAVFAVGGLAPIFTALNSPAGLTPFLLITGGVCFAAALALHVLARIVLRRLEP